MERASVHDLMLDWLAPQIESHGGPLTVGLCGPQGSGKSTVAEALRRTLERRGLRTAVLSLDDLYLRRAERERLAREVHPLLRTRGPPGTHDVALGLEVLGALAAGAATRLPRFHKAADDRRPTAEWEKVSGPVDVVLLEGWCVGARPQAPTALLAAVNTLELCEDPDGVWRRFVNDALAGPYQALFARLDRLALLLAPDFATVVRWRQQQEATLRARLARAGEAPGAAMCDAEVARFVQHYERLTRHIGQEAPARADLTLQLDPERRAQPLS